jgi:hypothetical protein
LLDNPQEIKALRKGEFFQVEIEIATLEAGTAAPH